jgi:hypothetical protein
LTSAATSAAGPNVELAEAGVVLLPPVYLAREVPVLGEFQRDVEVVRFDPSVKALDDVRVAQTLARQRQSRAYGSPAAASPHEISPTAPERHSSSQSEGK